MKSTSVFDPICVNQDNPNNKGVYKNITELYERNIAIRVKEDPTQNNKAVYMLPDSSGCVEDEIGFCGYIFVGYQGYMPAVFRLIKNKHYQCLQLAADPFVYLGFYQLNETSTYLPNQSENVKYIPKLVRLESDKDCYHPDYPATLYVDNYMNDCLNIATAFTEKKYYIEILSIPTLLEEANNSLIVRETMVRNYHFAFDTCAYAHNGHCYNIFNNDDFKKYPVNQEFYLFIKTNAFFDVGDNTVKPYNSLLEVSKPIGNNGRYLENKGITNTVFNDYLDIIQENLKENVIDDTNILKVKIVQNDGKKATFNAYWSIDGAPIIFDPNALHTYENCSTNYNEFAIHPCSGQSSLQHLFVTCPIETPLYIDNRWYLSTASNRKISDGSNLCFQIWISDPL